MTKIERIIYLIALTLATLGFLAAGTFKLTGSTMEAGMFAKWGYPLWFMYLIGVCEVAGAVGLHVKRVARLAAYCLVVLLAGAISTHVANNEGFVAPIPATVLLLSVLAIIYFRAKRASAFATPSDPAPEQHPEHQQ